MNWTHNNKPMLEHDDFTSDVEGFVYCITYTNGQQYIGQRGLYSTNTIPAKKSGILRDGAERLNRDILRFPDGKIAASKKDRAKARKLGIKAKREPYDRIRTPRSFARYEGSTDNSKGLIVAKKEIIELCTSKIDLTYCEVKWMFRFDVLFNDIFINDNIGGLYYRGKITKGL